MFELNSKNGEVLIFAETCEEQAVVQIMEAANSPLGENAHIRIMPDCHAGAGCVIGTTMRITDKVCPYLVGVDIGCGVDLVHTDIDFANRLQELDAVIRKYIPFGMATHSQRKPWRFDDLLCWDFLPKNVKDRAETALGTLGGGNHFIEAYADGWLAVHSGSRNIGLQVAEFWQNLAEQREKERRDIVLREMLQNVKPQFRQEWLNAHRTKVKRELSFLTGDDLQNYFHDVKIMQRFAVDNRFAMLGTIVERMGGKIIEHISSTHNYIDIEHMILRKGAISAQKGERLVIPLNMRDGVLICVGKGNPEWNFSAPHGAGRLYSRSEAKARFSVAEYGAAMQGIFSSCINDSTLDEAPFVYKNMDEIVRCIQPTVEIQKRLVPVFNFKANI